MADLAREFWWILFPLSAFAFVGWSQWLNYRRQKALLDVVKTYAEKGQDAPQAIMDALARASANDVPARQSVRQGTAGHYWSLVGLFTALCVGFTVASWGGLDGGTGALLIVAFVMGTVALWSLVCALVLQMRRPRD
jgi:Flp pilus assembly protein TadB